MLETTSSKKAEAERQAACLRTEKATLLERIREIETRLQKETEFFRAAVEERQLRVDQLERERGESQSRLEELLRDNRFKDDRNKDLERRIENLSKDQLLQKGVAKDKAILEGDVSRLKAKVEVLEKESEQLRAKVYHWAQ